MDDFVKSVWTSKYWVHNGNVGVQTENCTKIINAEIHKCR